VSAKAKWQPRRASDAAADAASRARDDGDAIAQRQGGARQVWWHGV